LDNNVVVSGQGPLKAGDIGHTKPKFVGAREKVNLVPILVLYTRNLFLGAVLAMIIHKEDADSGNSLE